MNDEVLKELEQESSIEAISVTSEPPYVLEPLVQIIERRLKVIAFELSLDNSQVGQVTYMRSIRSDFFSQLILHSDTLLALLSSQIDFCLRECNLCILRPLRITLVHHIFINNQL